MRLNKFLANCGLASRRKAEELIKAGRVSVNGQTVKLLSTTVDPDKDVVASAGRRCLPRQKYIYLAMNKPEGYVCTNAVFRGERSVFELLPPEYKNLKIAGRLDKDSQGLLLLSDDGDFIYWLTHPKFRQQKKYEVALGRHLIADDFFRLKKGIRLPEGVAKFDSFKKITGAKYQVTLHQGWKRQIRRMFEVIGARVISLKRVSEGKFELKNIALGSYCLINKEEIIGSGGQ